MHSITPEIAEARRSRRFYSTIAILPVAALAVLGFGSRAKPQVYVVQGAAPWQHGEMIRWHEPLGRLAALEPDDNGPRRKMLAEIDAAVRSGKLPQPPPATSDDVASEQGVRGEIVRAITRQTNFLMTGKDGNVETIARDAVLCYRLNADIAHIDATAPSLTGMVERRALLRIREIAPQLRPEIRRELADALAMPRPPIEPALESTRKAFLATVSRFPESDDRERVERAMKFIREVYDAPPQSGLEAARKLRRRHEFLTSENVPALPSAIFGTLAEMQTRRAVRETIARLKV